MIAAATLLTGACGEPAAQPPAAKADAAPAAAPVTLRAADGVTVHGLHYPNPRARAVVLLFHQAGSGKGEYASIAPRLVDAGYEALAIDQRSGGGLFGRNETAAALGRDASYLDAERDLEAAVAWATGRKLPIILWGSSYSAALVFRVAARHPETKAVLAFSPGEYLGEPGLVRDAVARVAAPVFVTSAADPAEIAAAKTLLAAARSAVRVQHVPAQGGVHGSSTLIPDKNPRGAADNWRAVLAFLAANG